MAIRKAVKLKTPPILFTRTQKIIREIQKELNGTFMTFWNSQSGGVCHQDVQGFYEVLQRIGKKDALYLFIKSDGGTGNASLRIVNLLRQFGKRLYTLAPLECASAATMIALGSDEIHMGPLAYLTAIDTSLTHSMSPTDVHNTRVSVSQDELNRVVNLWRKEAHLLKQSEGANPYGALYQYIHPLVIGAVDRASSLSVKICTEILRHHMKDIKKAERISTHLNSAYPSHSYPILKAEAKRIGLQVKELNPDLNNKLLNLHELYSEMGQQALTDYDEQNYHDNEILNIIETVGMQVYYQTDKDWHYRTEERRWVSMNDKSSWRKMEKVGDRTVSTIFHIR